MPTKEAIATVSKLRNLKVDVTILSQFYQISVPTIRKYLQNPNGVRRGKAAESFERMVSKYCFLVGVGWIERSNIRHLKEELKPFLIVLDR